jgi:hypothetical protein
MALDSMQSPYIVATMMCGTTVDHQYAVAGDEVWPIHAL